LATFMYLLARLESPASVRDLLLDTVQAGDWDLGRLLGVFVPIQLSSNGESLGDVSLDDVESFLGFDFLAANLNSETDPDVFDWSAVDDVSFEMRIARAHAVIVRHLRTRAAEADA
jgi:hypothetical protein